jgi:hypothetical protein
MVGSATEDLFGSFQITGPGADPHAFQQGDVEVAVDPAVKVASRYRDTTPPLQHSEMVRRYRESLGGF